MKRAIDWKLWTGLLISALFTYLAFRNVDLATTWLVIRSANPFFLCLVAVLAFLQFIFRVWRWDIFLEPIKNTAFSNRLHATFIGFAANCVLPARLGEFIRANYLGQREAISKSSTFGTIVVERLFDGFTLLLILMIGLLGTTFPGQWHAISNKLRAAGFILLLTYVIVIIFLVGFKYHAETFLEILDRILFFLRPQPRSRCLEVVRNFSLGLALSRSPLKWALAIFYSLLVWFTNLYQIELIEQSIGISLPFISVFLIMAMASLGVMIPSAPGYVGTFHLAVQYGFVIYGIGREEALSAAILWHAATVFPTIVFGLISWLLLHIPLGKLSEEAVVLRKDLGSTP